MLVSSEWTRPADMGITSGMGTSITGSSGGGGTVIDAAARFSGDTGTRLVIEERAAGCWRQAWPGEHQTLGQARAALISYLREQAAGPGGRAAGAYTQAADGLAQYHVSEVAAAGRLFRITRIQRPARTDAETSELTA
jgi:Family of unknown function (DUF5954)